MLVYMVGMLLSRWFFLIERIKLHIELKIIKKRNLSGWNSIPKTWAHLNLCYKTFQGKKKGKCYYPI